MLSKPQTPLIPYGFLFFLFPLSRLLYPCSSCPLHLLLPSPLINVIFHVHSKSQVIDWSVREKNLGCRMQSKVTLSFFSRLLNDSPSSRPSSSLDVKHQWLTILLTNDIGTVDRLGSICPQTLTPFSIFYRLRSSSVLKRSSLTRERMFKNKTELLKIMIPSCIKKWNTSCGIKVKTWYLNFYVPFSGELPLPFFLIISCSPFRCLIGLLMVFLSPSLLLSLLSSQRWQGILVKQ